MKKVMKDVAYSIDCCDVANKFIFGFSRYFAIISRTDKNIYKIEDAFPPLKHCKSLFLSFDRSKALILNTTGSGYVYSVDGHKKQVTFGDDFYSQCFASYADGFFYIDPNENLCWFSLQKLKSKHLTDFPKCTYLYDGGNRIFFFFIEKESYYSVDNILYIRIFYKETGKFYEKQLNLPQGAVESMREIDDNNYAVVFSRPDGEGVAYYGCLLDIRHNSLTSLLKISDYKNNCGYFIDFELDINKHKAYLLFSNGLNIIDLMTKNILSSIHLKDAITFKKIEDMFLISTLDGVYELYVEE